MAQVRHAFTTSKWEPPMADDSRQGRLLTMQQCRELFGMAEQIARSCGVHETEALFAAHRDALTRFANNTIHQNVAEQAQWLSIRVVVDHRTARATTNRFDAGSVRSAVEQAIALARAAAPDPDLLPMAPPALVDEIPRFDVQTAEATPEDRARAVASAILLVEGTGQTAAGIYSTGQTAEAILNSNGVADWHHETMSQFSITAMADDSSGWAKASSTTHSAFDPVELAGIASKKAAMSRDPREIAAGRYTVILEPAAVLDLVGQIFGDFSATAMHDKRSFLTDRMGVKLFGHNVNMYDDVRHPLQ